MEGLQPPSLLGRAQPQCFCLFSGNQSPELVLPLVSFLLHFLRPWKQPQDLP